MPKSKSKRSARTTRSAAFIRTPRILEKLPPTESSIKSLEAANNGLLLRIRFGSATRRDASELYTHLALCRTLVPHINEQYEAYDRLARGVLFLETYVDDSFGIRSLRQIKQTVGKSVILSIHVADAGSAERTAFNVQCSVTSVDCQSVDAYPALYIFAPHEPDVSPVRNAKPPDQ